MINIKTKLLGLLGNPLEHSFSPVMHNEAYEKNNMNFLYLPLEIEEENIEEVLKGIRHMNFIGLNVTIPYKIKIMEYLDEIDPLAEKIGSVNTVKIKNKKLIGYNTDGTGLLKSLEKDCKVKVRENRFLILGAGGASRSIAMTLADKGAKNIVIANRTISKAKSLSEDVNDKGNKCCSYININAIKNVITETDIIINTTSLGMYPKIENCPMDTDLLNKTHLVSDIIYNPVKTKLLIEAEKKGCKIQNGLGMLVNQGAEAFKIWTEEEAPVKDMEEVINNLISKE